MSAAFKRFDLKGKNAVVTGGATGIGYEMTRALAQAGARVMMAARREDVLQKSAAELMKDPDIDSVLYRRVDLSDRKSIKALSEYAISTMGGIDIFIGNAGTDAFEFVDSVTDNELDRQLQVNLASNIELTRDFLPHMRRQKWGRVIYSSSVMSIKCSSHEGLGVYAATKAGLNAYAKYVAAEAGRDGVTANTLIIGLIQTELMESFLNSDQPEAAKQAFLSGYTCMISAGRVGKPADFAGLIQLLASDAGSYISGADIPVDGGMTSTLRPHPK